MFSPRIRKTGSGPPPAQQKAAPFFQPKLSVNAPGDQYEQEADAVAQRVAQTPPGKAVEGAGAVQRQPEAPEEEPVQRKCAECEQKEKERIQRQEKKEEEEEKLQRRPEREEEQGPPVQTKPLLRKKAGGGYTATPALHARIAASKGSGASLPAPTRARMQSAFGVDFGQVRIHTDSRAADLNAGINARAFTHGSDIYFNRGEYAPDSGEGRKLLAHELTHVVQQRGGATLNKIQKAPPKSDIEIEIVPIPKSALSISQLIEDNINTKEAILVNYREALHNFEVIVNSSSQKEGEALIGATVVQFVTKFVFEKLLDGALEKLPHAKSVIDLITGTIEEVNKEKERAAKATESYKLGQFIINLARKITKIRTSLMSNKVEIKADGERKHKEIKSKTGKEIYRTTILIANERLTNTLANSASQESLFKLISEQWITQNTSSGSGYLKIVINNKWEVTYAHLHVPRGQRIAEQLLKDSNGEIDLNKFYIRRNIEYIPEPLSALYYDFDASGRGLGALSATLGGKKYAQSFIDKLRQGLPSTKLLTGD